MEVGAQLRKVTSQPSEVVAHFEESGSPLEVVVPHFEEVHSGSFGIGAISLLGEM